MKDRGVCKVFDSELNMIDYENVITDPKINNFFHNINASGGSLLYSVALDEDK